MDRHEPLGRGGRPARGAPKPGLRAAGSLSLSHPDFLSLAEALLASPGAFRFEARGRSMLPFIRHGDDLVVEAFGHRPPQAGDVVLLRGPGGAARVHRLVHRLPDGGWLAHGDGLRHPDPPVSEADLLGRVTTRERNGVARRLDRPPSRFAGRAWAALHLLRRLREAAPRRARLAVWVVRLTWSVARLPMLAAVGLVILQGLLPVVLLYLLKRIVDGVIAPAAPGAPGAAAVVFTCIALSFVAALLIALARTAAGRVQDELGHRTGRHILDRLHAHAARLDLSRFEDPACRDLLHRTRAEAPHRPGRMIAGAMQAAQAALTLAGLAGVLLTVSAWMVPAALAVAGPLLLAWWIRGARILYREDRALAPLERETGYLHHVLVGDEFSAELRTFGTAGRLQGSHRDQADRLHGERMRLARLRGRGQLAIHAASSAIAYGGFAWLAWQTLRGRFTPGDLVLYGGAFQRAQSVFQDLLRALAALYEDSLFLAGYQEFLALAPRVREPVAPRAWPVPLTRGLVLDRVTFRYPGHAAPALQEVNLHIAPGSRVALIGRNGSGKTTCLKLMLRLYDPETGRITIDGADLSAFASDDIHRRIRVLFQEFPRYQFSVAENIRLGDGRTTADGAAVEAAARRAGADGVIGGLPRGLETRLGNWFFGGTELSRGEWQKVALARALVSPAQILVLDEPTSAMDAESEAAVLDRLLEVRADAAVVLITHRIPATRRVDRVYVFDQGRIVEEGAPAELLKRGGPYATLAGREEGPKGGEAEDGA